MAFLFIVGLAIVLTFETWVLRGQARYRRSVDQIMLRQNERITALEGRADKHQDRIVELEGILNVEPF
jgi:hypothetical protein